MRVFKDELRQAIAHPGQAPAMSSPATSTTTTAAPRSSFRLVPGSRRYLSESVNLAHASAGTLSVKLPRSVVSLTRIKPAPLAVSTQELPDVPE
jgi:hypothetical protein